MMGSIFTLILIIHNATGNNTLTTLLVKSLNAREQPRVDNNLKDHFVAASFRYNSKGRKETKATTTTLLLSNSK